MGQEPALQDTSLDNQRVVIDVNKALKLRIEHNLSYRDIADKLGVSKSAVHQALQRFHKLITNPESVIAYRENKANLLDAVELELVSNLADSEKLKKASINNLAYSISQIDHIKRLERNQSTANIAYSDGVRHHDSLKAQLAENESKLARYGIDNTDLVEGIDTDD